MVYFYSLVTGSGLNVKMCVHGVCVNVYAHTHGAQRPREVIQIWETVVTVTSLPSQPSSSLACLFPLSYDNTSSPPVPVPLTPDP